MGTEHLIGRLVDVLRGDPTSPRTAGLFLLVALLAATGGGVAAGALTGESGSGQPAQAEPRPARAAHVEPRGLGRSAPVQLLIPKLDVAAEVVPLTLEEGTLTAPARASVAGWYEGGTSPGEPGSAVIVGLAGHDSGDQAVFARLDRLAASDAIEVIREDGSNASFAVDRVADDSHDNRVYRSGGGVELRLVQWDGTGPDASPQLVVFATLAS